MKLCSGSEGVSQFKGIIFFLRPLFLQNSQLPISSIVVFILPLPFTCFIF